MARIRAVGPFEAPVVDAVWLDSDHVALAVDRRIVVWTVTESQAEPQVRFEWAVTSLARLPSGRVAVGLSNGVVRIIDVAAKADPVVIQVATDGPVKLAVDSTGAWLATASETSGIALWDAASGAAKTVVAKAPVVGTALAFVGSGSASAGLVAGCEDGSVIEHALDGASAPVRRKAHEGPVNAIAPLSGAGYLTGGSDKRAIPWRNGVGGAPLGGHTSWVSAAAGWDDGRHAATGTADGLVATWMRSDGASGEAWTRTAAWRAHNGGVTALAASPTGKHFVSCGVDGTACLWESEPAPAYDLDRGHQADVFAVCWSPDGRLLASASGDQTARIWDAESGLVKVVCVGHTQTVTSVAFHPRSTFIATGSADGTVGLWRVDDGRRVATLVGHQAPVSAVAFDPTGRWIVSGSADRTVRIWDVESHELLRTLEGHRSDLKALVFSRDGTTLASAAADNTVRLWDPNDGRLVRTIHRGPALDHVHTIAFGPHASWIAGGSLSGLIQVWALPGGELVRTLQGHEGSVEGIGISPDGRVITSASADRTIRAWSSEDGTPLWTVRPHLLTAYAASPRPDGRVIATCSSDRTIKLLDNLTGRVLRTLPEVIRPITAVEVLSHQGSVVAGSGDGVLSCFWFTEQRDGPPHQRLAWIHTMDHDAEIVGLAHLEADDRVVAATADGTLATFAARTGMPRKSLVIQDRLTALARVGAKAGVAVGLSRGRVAIVDVDSAAVRLLDLPVPVGAVHVLACSDDGTRLAVGGEGSAVVIEVATGALLFQTDTLRDAVSSLSFSADGARLAVGCVDGTVAVCDLAMRRTTFQERRHTSAVVHVALAGATALDSVSADGSVWVDDASRRRAFLGHGSTTACSRGLAMFVSGHEDGTLQWVLPREATSRTLSGAVTRDGHWMLRSGDQATHSGWSRIVTSQPGAEGAVTYAAPPAGGSTTLTVDATDVELDDCDRDGAEISLFIHDTTANPALEVHVSAVTNGAPGVLVEPVPTIGVIDGVVERRLRITRILAPSTESRPADERVEIRVESRNAGVTLKSVRVRTRRPRITPIGFVALPPDATHHARIQFALQNDGDQPTGPGRILAGLALGESEPAYEVVHTVASIAPGETSPVVSIEVPADAAEQGVALVFVCDRWPTQRWQLANTTDTRPTSRPK